MSLPFLSFRYSSRNCIVWTIVFIFIIYTALTYLHMGEYTHQSIRYPQERGSHEPQALEGTSEVNSIEMEVSTEKDNSSLPLVADKTPKYTHKSPWTWKCGEDGKCHRKLKTKEDYYSLDSCWLTCGKSRGFWPQPRNISHIGMETIVFELDNFKLAGLNSRMGPRVKNLTEAAFQIMTSNIRKMYPENHKNGVDVSNNSVELAVSIEIESDVDTLTFSTDESYTLLIKKSESSKQVLIQITGSTFFGVRHGLETLSQCVVFDDGLDTLKILTEVDLSDSPAFPYRGLMIDSARNFMSISSIRRTLDGMAYNKLNVLHWHLTDSNSFPLFCPTYPQMTDYGAYSKNEIYYPEDVVDLVEYAIVRGIKIVPEIDVPGHAGNGWQWGEDTEGIGELALCVNKEPWSEFCGQPPCGQLNVANPKVFEVLSGIYDDMLQVFKSDLFHMGGDEVTLTCWQTEEIENFMKKNYMRQNFDLLRLYFQNKAYDALRETARKRNIKHPIPIIWTSEITDILGLIDATSPKRRYDLNPADFIIQVWNVVPSTNANFRELISKNYSLIISNGPRFYLDSGVGTWLGKAHNLPYVNWQTIYNTSFEDLGYDTTKYVTHSRFGKLPQVLGGESPLWSEKVGDGTQDAKFWPRGCALAERLWLNPNETSVLEKRYIYARLLHHNERMKLRGIPVDTRQPKSCLLIDSVCYNEGDEF